MPTSIDLTHISFRDPVRLQKLAGLYRLLDNTLQPPYTASDGAVVPDGVNLLSTASIFTSTNWTEIDTALTVTFSHEITRDVLAILPLWWNVASATTVAEIGIMIDNVVDTNSVIRVSSTATTATGQPPLLSTLLFPLASKADGSFANPPAPIGTYVIKPVVRIVSGATPQINIRYNRSTRLIVRDM